MMHCLRTSHYSFCIAVNSLTAEIRCAVLLGTVLSVKYISAFSFRTCLWFMALS